MALLKVQCEEFYLLSKLPLFWDRVERANIFFDNILNTADRPLDDRTVYTYMQGPDTDGGQWAMAVSLIRKYGLVPTYAQDESFSANNTAMFNRTLNMKLREDGLVCVNFIKKRNSMKLKLSVKNS